MLFLDGSPCIMVRIASLVFTLICLRFDSKVSIRMGVQPLIAVVEAYSCGIRRLEL